MARLTIYNDLVSGTPEKIGSLRQTLEKGFNVAYPEFDLDYSGWMIPEGVMKNTPFWIVDDTKIGQLSEVLDKFLNINSTFHARIYVKDEQETIDHIGRTQWDVTYKAVYDR